MRPDVVTKTSLMLGLGEEDEEVIQTMKELREIGNVFVALYERKGKGRAKRNRIGETFPANYLSDILKRRSLFQGEGRGIGRRKCGH